MHNQFPFLRNAKALAVGVASTLFLTVAISLINFKYLELRAFRFDEIAVSVASAHMSLDWVLKGFSDYFYPYPEFAEPATNFIRPVLNLFYFITGYFNLGMTGRLISITYAFHALNVVIIFSILKSQPLTDRLLGVTILALSPAFWLYPTPFYPAFGSEILVGTFVISALISFGSKREGVGAIFLAAALLTKEAALPFAAAFIVYGVWIRNVKTIIIPTLLLSGFMVLRYINFGSFSGGIYINFSALGLTQIVARIFEFPNFYVVGSELKMLVADHSFGFQYFYIFANAVSIGMLLIYAWSYRHFIANGFTRRLQQKHTAADPILLAWISFGFALLYFVIVSGFSRFSYTTLLAFLFALALSPPSVLMRMLKSILLLGHFIGFFAALDRNEAYFQSNMIMNMAANKLKAHVLSTASLRPVYIVNDIVTGYSKPSDFARLIGSAIDLRRGTSVDIQNCSVSDLAQIRIETEHDAKAIRIGVALPNCAKFMFEGASRAKMIEHTLGDWLVRNDQIAYRATLNGEAISVADLGEMKSASDLILITRVQNAEILYFDFRTNEWVNLVP
jgi:hypothetical protein